MKYILAILSTILIGCEDSGSLLLVPRPTTPVADRIPYENQLPLPPLDPSLTIPADAGWFYATDSFSLFLPHTKFWHYPGSAYSSKLLWGGDIIDIYIVSASMGLIMPPNQGDMSAVNSDLNMCLYDIAEAPAKCVALIRFSPPYGVNLGMIINTISNPLMFAQVERDWGYNAPLKLSGQIPPTWTSVYQIGPAMYFHLVNPTPIVYNYHIHGAIGVR